ncbi:MAG TPA: hypothetical protein VHO70_20265 [Chitinispirillaceae bacterium]|nr:hypothetical protein [Chitinispirillaceae bacterium]
MGNCHPVPWKMLSGRWEIVTRYPEQAIPAGGIWHPIPRKCNPAGENLLPVPWISAGPGLKVQALFSHYCGYCRNAPSSVSPSRVIDAK